MPPTNDKEDAKAATRRANSERRARLALIDNINAVLDTPHTDVDTLVADIRAAMNGDNQ